jgi:hydrogenase maturation protease
LNETLVIGYGNPLRGDDGAGPRAAAAVAAWELKGVTVMTSHQVLPEMAEAVSLARAVVFIDATVGRENAEVDCRPIEPRPTPTVVPHIASPGALLALADFVYGRRPPAWWITIPAVEFGFVEGLSARAQRGLETALVHARKLLVQLSGERTELAPRHEPIPACMA